MRQLRGLASAALIVAVACSACSAAGTAGDPPAASVGSGGTVATSNGTAFTSTVYGYTALAPAGWAVDPATSQWDGSDIDHMAGYADRFDGADEGFLFTIGSPTTEPLAHFAESHVAWVKANRGCPESSAPVDSELDGAPAVRVVLRCPAGIYGPTLVSKAMTVRDGQGVIVTGFSPDTGSETFPAFDGFLASMRWVGT